MHKNAEELRTAYKSSGTENMDSRQLVALLLSYAQSNADPWPVTDELFRRFGSMPNILEADAEVLECIPGLSKSAAAMLNAFPCWIRNLALSQHPVREKLNTPYAAARLAVDTLIGATTEISYAIYLDGRYNHLHTRLLSRGTLDGVDMLPRDVVQYAILYRAKQVILVHNHPSGSLKASNQDLAVTETIFNALSPIRVTLVDHFIVAGYTCVSLAYAPDEMPDNVLAGYPKSEDEYYDFIYCFEPED